MDEPPFEEHENAIDIFILSTDDTVASLLKGHLEQKDYRVTIFTGNAQLMETLRSGKPNLLICDSTTPEQEGFQVCRQIKADDDLFVIPVLMLTAASTIEDLLAILDCNADNFIAPPYDLPDYLLLIEHMITTTVERQTPDQVKQQFTVRHDDQTYVVTASRRKLIEYLLSSFDIAVSKSREISRVTSELRELSGSVTELERSVAGHIQAIEQADATVRQKEQKIIALIREHEEMEKALAQKNEEIGNIAQERDDGRALVSTHEETIRTMAREREEAETTHRSQTGALTTRISALEAEAGTQKISLDTLQNALIGETNRSESLEKTFRALTLEYEQQKTAFVAEKNRAISAEQEIIVLTQAKARSEKDLARTITDLDEAAKQQAAEIARLKGEMEAETSRRVLAEDQVVSLRRELEQLVLSSHSEIDILNQQAGKLQETLAASAIALENAESTITSQQEHLAEVIAKKENAESQLESVSTQLAEAHAAVESREQERKSLAEKLGEVTDELEKSGQQVSTLSAALDKAQSDIEAERDQCRTAEEAFGRTTRERDDALGSLRQEHDDVRADLDLHKVILAQRERELEAATAIRVTLEGELDAAKTRNQALLEEMDRAEQHRDQSGEQFRSLAGELEQVIAALETERGLRQTSEEKLAAAIGQQERLGQDLRRAQEEIERVKEDQAATTRQCEEKMASASQQVQSLETQVSTLTREKLQVGEEDRALPSEPGTITAVPDPGHADAEGPAGQKTIGDYLHEESAGVEDEKEQPAPGTDVQTGRETVEVPGSPGEEAASGGGANETHEGPCEGVPGDEAPFDRTQWLDLLKWAHHTDALSPEQRSRIVRMGRLTQKGRKLTNKQHEQVREIIALVRSLGYGSPAT